MTHHEKELLLERAMLRCFNLVIMAELSQHRPMPPKFQARLDRETLEELRALEIVLETMQDDLLLYEMTARTAYQQKKR